MPRPTTQDGAMKDAPISSRPQGRSRLKILAILEDAKAHMTAEDVTQAMLAAGEVGLATVCRVLTSSSQPGSSCATISGRRAVFEMNGVITRPHGVCRMRQGVRV
jgi:Fe2+ or Zn2+ uptake regulation protein